MKQIKKKDEKKTTDLIISTRYGHLNISSKDEPAFCSLPVVAAYLKLPLSDVRRLYRRFFLRLKPTKKLLYHQLDYLIDPTTLQKTATYTLP